MANKIKAIIAISSVVLLIVTLVVVLVLTMKPSSDSVSVPSSCASNVQKCSGRNELFHSESEKCFKKGESPEGICSRNMVISPLVNCKRQGICECNYDHDRWLVYHKGSNQCYFLYSQGFCQPGEWVVFGKEDAVCRPSICKSEQEKEPGADEWVPYNGKCHKLFSKTVPGCGGRELRFKKGQIKLSCDPPLSTSAVGGIPEFGNKCPPGSLQAVNGLCQPSIIIEFDDY